MATTTITISSVECHLMNNYRYDGSGNPILIGQYVVCPTAIECPANINSYSYNLTLTGVDSADSSASYELVGNNGNTVIGFTEYDPSIGTDDGDWQNDPVGFPSYGTHYLAILPAGHYGNNYVTYTLAGTVTFDTTKVYYADLSVQECSATLLGAVTSGSPEIVTINTNKIQLGSSKAKKYYLGDSFIRKIYLGSNLIYDATLTEGEQYGILTLSTSGSLEIDSTSYNITLNGVNLLENEPVIVDTLVNESYSSIAKGYYIGNYKGITPPDELNVYAYIDSRDYTINVYVEEEIVCDVGAYVFFNVRWTGQLTYQL